MREVQSQYCKIYEKVTLFYKTGLAIEKPPTHGYFKA